MKYQLRWYVVQSHAEHNEEGGYEMEKNVHSGEAVYSDYDAVCGGAAVKLNKYSGSTLLELKIIPWSE